MFALDQPSSLIPRKRLRIRHQFLRFAGVGLIGTAAHYLVLVALVQRLGANPIPASMCGFTAGGVVNYILNYHFTFQSKESHHNVAVKFFTMALLGLALNSLILTMGIKIFALHYLPAQVIATCLVLIWNFTGNRWWTFSDSGCTAKYE